MDYDILGSAAFVGLAFIFLRKQLASIIMESLVKTVQKKYNEQYKKFIEGWMLVFGIIIIIMGIYGSVRK